MRSIVGLFVQIPSLESAEVSKRWFDRVVKDRRKDSPYYIGTLALEFIGGKLPDGRQMLFEEHLDWIKDYLPHFDNLFVGSFPPKVLGAPDITDSNFRRRHILASGNVANQFIDYLRTRNITIPIHWYINWEANLNRLISRTRKNAWKAYILQFTNHLTEISHRNGLNEPEFLWSPYFGKRYGSLLPSEKNTLISHIRYILQSVPRLGWLHFQDGVGANSKKNSDGTITYRYTAEDAINYYHHILVPASGGNLRSGLVNMEFFVDPDLTLTGDPLEHEDRQCKYMRANIPVGVSWEVSFWYGSVINEIEISLKNIFIDKGISFPVSISGVAHDLGLSPPISIKDLVCYLRH